MFPLWTVSAPKLIRTFRPHFVLMTANDIVKSWLERSKRIPLAARGHRTDEPAVNFSNWNSNALERLVLRALPNPSVEH